MIRRIGSATMLASAAGLILVAGLLALASRAEASVTLGQLRGPPLLSGCFPGVDWVQPSVTEGDPYVAPTVAGVTKWKITSWSTLGNAEPVIPEPRQMMGLKVFRNEQLPFTYRVVGHEGPHPITPSALNTFPASIPVQTGDLVGLTSATNGAPCLFSVPGETNYNRTPPLADGASATFTLLSGFRLNVTAVLVPSTTITVGKTTRNKKKGTATLTLKLPNPGELTASGKGVKVRSAAGATISKSVTPGRAQLLIKAKGKEKKTLNATGKVKLRRKITYTPTGGDPSTRSVKVKLIKQ